MKTEILSEIIRRSGHTQADIARKMNISPQSLNWMINNPVKLRIEQLDCFAKAVRRSPRNLFSLIINN